MQYSQITNANDLGSRYSNPIEYTSSTVPSGQEQARMVDNPNENAAAANRIGAGLEVQK